MRPVQWLTEQGVKEIFIEGKDYLFMRGHFVRQVPFQRYVSRLCHESGKFTCTGYGSRWVGAFGGGPDEEEIIEHVLRTAQWVVMDIALKLPIKQYPVIAIEPEDYILFDPKWFKQPKRPTASLFMYRHDYEIASRYMGPNPSGTGFYR